MYGNQPYGTDAFSTLPSAGAPATQTIAPASIATAQAVGIAALALTIAVSGIGPVEAVGSPSVVAVVQPAAVQPTEAVGVAQVVAVVLPAGIDSKDALGAVQVAHAAILSGTPTAEAVGSPSVSYATPDGTAIVAGIACSSAIGQVVALGTSADDSGRYVAAGSSAGPVRSVDARAEVHGVLARAAVGFAHGIGGSVAVVAGVGACAAVGAVDVAVGLNEEEEEELEALLLLLDEV